MGAWPTWIPCRQVPLALTCTALRLAWLRQRGIKKEQMSIQWSRAWLGHALQWKCTSSLEVLLLLKMLLTESTCSEALWCKPWIPIYCWSSISMWVGSSLISWANSTRVDFKLSLSLWFYLTIIRDIPMLSTHLMTITKNFLYTPWSF